MTGRRIDVEAYENIMSRSSVRSFKDIEISDEEVRKILAAGMAAPSCVNRRDWSFLVTRDPEILGRMADCNGRPAEPLRKAKLGILVLGDLERAFSRAPDYWIIDASIAAENMVLAANALGIGSVWLGTYPQADRVDALRKEFSLPDTVVPHSIIAFGYPSEEEAGKGPRGFYEDDRVHFDKW